jgi:hypothetical protein
MAHPRILVVRWRDAHYDSDESVREEVMKAHRSAIYWSVGVLVQSDATGITLAQDLGLPLSDGESTYRTRTFIPRELVEAEFDAGIVMRKKRIISTEEPV